MKIVLLLPLLFFSFQKNEIFNQNLCDDPIAECHPSLSIDVIPLSGQVEIWASDFYSGNQDCFNVFDFRIAKVFDSDRNGQIDSSEYLRGDIIDDVLSFGCESLGDNFVQLRVSDDEGNFDDCITKLEIQDNNGVCLEDIRIITACAETENHIPVGDIDFKIEINNSWNQSQNGFCLSFRDDIREVHMATITAEKQDTSLFMLSKQDVYLIGQHILGNRKLDSPYKLIAADVDNSGSITVRDMIALRKVLVGRENSFPNNQPWRFIPSNFVFPNPENPWESTFREFGTFDEDLDHWAGKQINFIAVRIGNVE